MHETMDGQARKSTYRRLKLSARSSYLETGQNTKYT